MQKRRRLLSRLRFSAKLTVRLQGKVCDVAQTLEGKQHSPPKTCIKINYWWQVHLGLSASLSYMPIIGYNWLYCLSAGCDEVSFQITLYLKDTILRGQFRSLQHMLTTCSATEMSQKVHAKSWKACKLKSAAPVKVCC